MLRIMIGRVTERKRMLTMLMLDDMEKGGCGKG
jgi:hypothetical protein